MTEYDTDSNPCDLAEITVYCITTVFCTDSATVTLVTYEVGGSLRKFWRLTGLLKMYTPRSTRLEFSIMHDCVGLVPTSHSDVKTLSVRTMWPNEE